MLQIPIEQSRAEAEKVFLITSKLENRPVKALTIVIKYLK
jgi:hypothetical protein